MDCWVHFLRDRVNYYRVTSASSSVGGVRGSVINWNREGVMMEREMTVMRLNSRTTGQFLRGGCPSRLLLHDEESDK